MKNTIRMKGWLVVAGCALLAAGPAGAADEQDGRQVTDAEVQVVLKRSFWSQGIAALNRLNQDDVQKTCTQYAATKLPKKVAAEIEKAQLATVKYPADGKWLGDWKKGETVAQTGRGLQFSDKADAASGGNCYACHQLSPKELSFGNIGPSLLGYGKTRGNSEAVLKYTWGKIYNSNAYSACSNMPRFGHAGILTEAQIRDVMALLLDPESPVNK